MGVMPPSLKTTTKYKNFRIEYYFPLCLFLEDTVCRSVLPHPTDYLVSPLWPICLSPDVWYQVPMQLLF